MDRRLAATDVVAHRPSREQAVGSEIISGHRVLLGPDASVAFRGAGNARAGSEAGVLGRAGEGPKLPGALLPDGAVTGPDGRLSIAGCDVADLAAEFGTPLFVYDEDHLRRRCREAVAAFPDGAAYATKAFLCTAMARLAFEEGMDLDVATGGELHVAHAAGVPADRLVFHGNNKLVEAYQEVMRMQV